MARSVCVFAAVALAVTGSFFIAPREASAELICKGLDHSICTATSGCGWTKGFTRKDGRVVKAFCRKKPVRKTAEIQPLPVQTASKSVN